MTPSQFNRTFQQFVKAREARKEGAKESRDRYIQGRRQVESKVMVKEPGDVAFHPWCYCSLDGYKRALRLLSKQLSEGSVIFYSDYLGRPVEGSLYIVEDEKLRPLSNSEVLGAFGKPSLSLEQAIQLMREEDINQGKLDKLIEELGE